MEEFEPLTEEQIAHLATLEQAAVERIRLAAEMSRKYFDLPIYICISGGKDSTVLQEIALRAGIDCVYQHAITTADAPETVYFVRSEFRRLEANGASTAIVPPKKSMWRMIRDRYGLPPLRTMRYCCAETKEKSVKRLLGGKPCFIATGVRWAESAKRKTRGEFEAIASKREKRVTLINDSDPARKLFEECRLKSERVVNPIIDWSDADVWDYIHWRALPYNPLYDEGFDRVGCIGCPMAGRHREREFERWPKYKAAYIAAIERGLKYGDEVGHVSKFKFHTAQELFDWWMTH